MQQRRRRSRLIVGFLSLGLLAGAAMTASPAQAATGPGPYYAEPAWSQKLAPAKRFVVLTDWFSEAVLDKETGLVWEKATASDIRVWEDDDLNNARFACATRVVGGRKGWRLPSIVELASLIDPTQSFPALPLGHPFTIVLTTQYWSATTDARNSSNAWWFQPADGRLGTLPKSSPSLVWCVRGGMNAEAY